MLSSNSLQKGNKPHTNTYTDSESRNEKRKLRGDDNGEIEESKVFQVNTVVEPN